MKSRFKIQPRLVLMSTLVICLQTWFLNCSLAEEWVETSFDTEVKNGEKYSERKMFDEAFKCYRKAAFLKHGWGWDQSRLLISIEQALNENPFNPDGRVALARVYENYNKYSLAAAEYKLADSLTKGDKSSIEKSYEECLASIKRDAEKTQISSNSAHDIALEAIRKFKNDLASQWNFPSQEKLLITKIWVYADKSITAEIAVPSGNLEHDKSALEAIKQAPFSSLQTLTKTALAFMTFHLYLKMARSRLNLFPLEV